MSSLVHAQFSDMVKEEFIVTDLAAASRDEALENLAEILVSRGVCAPTFPQAIIDREREHPSALPMRGHKIAIPHTDAEHVYESMILFARLKRPVLFRAMGSPADELPVRLISMFALREQDQIGDLLETLITVFQDEPLLDRIIRAPSPRHVYALLYGAIRGQDR